MIVSSRIKTVASFIEAGEKVADIGADHGILELYLLAKFDDVQITAIENKAGPYKILDHSLRGFKNIRLSYSDGLEAVERETTTLVLAGMGGLNIKKILEAYPQKVSHNNKIIIDAHRDKDIARKCIVNFGFKIEKEIIVYEEGIFYVVSEFLRSEDVPNYSEDELAFGYQIYLDPLWPKYRDFLISENNKTIAKIKDKIKLQDKVLKLEKMNERLRAYGKN